MSEYTTLANQTVSAAVAEGECRLSNSGILGPQSPSAEKTGSEIQLENPPYYHQRTHESWPGVVASVDMIRQTLTLRADKHDWLVGHLDTVMSDSVDYYTANRIGKYQSMWVYTFGETTATVGVGLVGSGKVDLTKGFFEFNPNKLGGVKEFYGIRQTLDAAGARFETSRFDMAFDLPGKRSLYQLVKDRRKYEYHNGGAISEYLGQRNKVGRVKLYDKQKESKLSKPLTRLEITVGEEFSTAVKAWPRLLGLETIKGMTSTNIAVAAMLKRLSELGEPIEPYLAMVDKKTKRRLKQFLETGYVDFPIVLVCELYKQVQSWRDLGALPPNE